jgi:hypothetical protein
MLNEVIISFRFIISRGIEWVSLHSFMTFAHPQPGPSGLVRNELMLTDIQTGKSVPYRTHRDEESHIDMVKVSFLKSVLLSNG